ncbi:MAG: HDOD domain-containing protein [Planctomycetota bacterium]
MRMTLDELAGSVDQLAPETRVLQRVLEVTGDQDFRVEDLVTVVQLDAGLTGHVLRFCNSALFSLPRVIESLAEATMYLGSRQVANLAVTFCTSRSFFSGDFETSPFDRQALWSRSIASAFASDLLANQASLSSNGTAYTAGLLHDVGLSIFCQQLGSYRDIVRRADDCFEALPDCEREVLGFDHCELGAEIARRWRFSERLIESIQCHHDHADAVLDRGLTATVRLADSMAWQIVPDPRFRPVDCEESALRVLHLSLEHVDQSKEFVGSQMQIAGELLSI